jgi:S-adenosylmethionine synthetase
MVPHLADVLRSEEFRSHFPVMGDDYKVMGSRYNDEITLTVGVWGAMERKTC